MMRNSVTIVFITDMIIIVVIVVAFDISAVFAPNVIRKDVMVGRHWG